MTASVYRAQKPGQFHAKCYDTKCLSAKVTTPDGIPAWPWSGDESTYNEAVADRTAHNKKVHPGDKPV